MHSDEGSRGFYIGDHCIRLQMVAVSDGLLAEKRTTIISLDEDLEHYEGFCDDFGPMNLASIYQFSRLVEAALKSKEDEVAVVSNPDRRSVTNAVFLIGAYLIITKDLDEQEVEDLFDSVISWIEPYRDVSPGPRNFDLLLTDCWEGLATARRLGWVSFAPGEFNIDDYLECDSPLNADLHEVVPGKLVAMRGPQSIPDGRRYIDHPNGSRRFSPAHYADILHQFDVQVVVRLNEAHYDAREFEEEGLAVADLPFDDCSAPPPSVVAKFLAIAEGVPGALAVHCSAGLGRTGALIACYMMKHHGFSARSAMGWLRIVRPGSVIGEQQDFLVASEGALRAAGEGFRRRGGAAVMVSPGAGVAAVSSFIHQAIAAADVRAVQLALRCRPPQTRPLSHASSCVWPLNAAGAGCPSVDNSRSPTPELSPKPGSDSALSTPSLPRSSSSTLHPFTGNEPAGPRPAHGEACGSSGDEGGGCGGREVLARHVGETSARRALRRSQSYTAAVGEIC